MVEAAAVVVEIVDQLLEVQEQLTKDLMVKMEVELFKELEEVLVLMVLVAELD